MSEVSNRLQAAHRRFDAARLLQRHEFGVDTMNRLSFGVLESARALLLLRNLTPKTRRGTGLKLGQHVQDVVEVGVLTRLRQNREEADYDLWEPSSGEVETHLKQAAEFVEAPVRRVRRAE